MSSEKKNIGVTVHFALERKTAGALRYKEIVGPDDETPVTVNEGAKIGTLYIRKSTFGEKHPRRLSVRVRRVRSRVG